MLAKNHTSKEERKQFGDTLDAQCIQLSIVASRNPCLRTRLRWFPGCTYLGGNASSISSLVNWTNRCWCFGRNLWRFKIAKIGDGDGSEVVVDGLPSACQSGRKLRGLGRDDFVSLSSSSKPPQPTFQKFLWPIILYIRYSKAYEASYICWSVCFRFLLFGPRLATVYVGSALKAMSILNRDVLISCSLVLRDTTPGV